MCFSDWVGRFPGTAADAPVRLLTGWPVAWLRAMAHAPNDFNKRGLLDAFREPIFRKIKALCLPLPFFGHLSPVSYFSG
jgi:hypothetical protein